MPPLIRRLLGSLSRNVSWKVLRASFLGNHSARVFRAILFRNTRNAVSRLRFRVVSGISRNSIEIRGMPAVNCGFHDVNGTSRNFPEKCERCRPQTAAFASPMIIRETSSRYEQCPSFSADSALPIVFHAISSRNAGNADSKLRTSCCQQHFAQFH